MDLRTERLLLRPFRVSDVDDLYAIYGDERAAFFALPGSMTREGYFRSHVLRRGERCDRVCYGILREEWEGALQNL